MNGNLLVRSGIVLCVGLAKEFCSAIYALQHQPPPQTIVRMVRGKKMNSPAALFNEFAAALQFPCYFGDNWNAFDECIADLEWLAGDAYVIAIVDAGAVLRDEPAELEVFFRIMRSVAREWRDMHGRRFQLMLQCTDDEVENVRRTLDEPVDVIPVNELR